MKKYILIATIFFLVTPCFAEKIILKSGQTVEAKVLEKGDKFIKVDFDGVELVYYFDEIDSIDGQQVAASVVKSELNKVVVENVELVSSVLSSAEVVPESENKVRKVDQGEIAVSSFSPD